MKTQTDNDPKINIAFTKKTTLNRIINFLFSQNSFPNRYWYLGISVVFGLLVAALILKHEPWFDEAQAWLLARDASIIDLFVKYLRYEGSPGLWHLLLTIPAKLDIPYIFLNIFAGIIGLCGVIVFIRHSPFPNFMKILLPFTYFIFYQYTVIARSYVLIPVLLFLIATEYPNRISKPIRFTLLVILLSLISIHTTIISGFIMVFHLIEYIKIRNTLSKNSHRNTFFSYLLYLIFLVLIALTIKPPADLVVSGGVSIKALLTKGIDLQQIAPGILVILSDAFISNISGDKLTPIHVLSFLATFFLLMAFIYFFKINGKLHYFLGPLVALLAFFSIGYFSIWHSGIIFLLFIFVLWITIQDSPVLVLRAPYNLLILIIIFVQLFWSASAFMLDWKYTYSGSKDIARYILEHRLTSNKILAKNPKTTSILPYFRNNIFDNYNRKYPFSFWMWSKKNYQKTDVFYIENEKPDLLIIGYTRNRNLVKRIKKFPLSSYQLIQRFDGYLVWKNSIYERETFLLFQLNSKYRDKPLPKQDIVNLISLWQDSDIQRSKEYK